MKLLLKKHNPINTRDTQCDFHAIKLAFSFKKLADIANNYNYFTEIFKEEPIYKACNQGIYFTFILDNSYNAEVC